MIVSIDESGTHRQEGFSVIALVCVEGIDALAALDAQIEQLERTIGISHFHWAQKGRPIRRDFVKGLAEMSFTVRIAQVSNPVSLDRVLEEVLPYLITERHLERVFIDGSKPKSYGRSLKKVLRDKGITVKKIKPVNDESYPSIRVADAIAGAFRYYLDKPNTEADTLYKAIESKIEFIHLRK